MPEGLFMAGIVTLVAINTALGPVVGWWARGRMEPEPDEDLTFIEVCEAAARAKEERRTDENPTRDYTDGADAVMSELMEMGYCETPEEMKAAYLVGGDEVELEAFE